MTPRLRSLDAFRGLTIAGMLLVNDPGSWSYVYRPLDHAEWNGWTPTDLIFPFFLFIVGISLTLSFARRMEQGASPRDLLRKVAARAGVIFALGLLLNGFPHYNLSTIRIMGVLQRIAVVYLITGILFVTTGERAQRWIVAGVLVGYWAVMTLVPVPGVGAGILERQGNLAQSSTYVLFTAGFALVLLATIYYLIDMRGRERWAWPWYVFGTNSILAFVASGLFARILLLSSVTKPDGSTVSLYTWIYERGFASWAGPMNGSLAFAIAYVALFLGAMAVLYEKRWFVKI